MLECIFCSYAGKLTHEHIVSQWIAKLFRGPITSRIKVNDEMREFGGDSIDYKAKTVCKSCNEGWMSDIENSAKPVLTPLIKGNLDLPITTTDARSIARFAFSKAVVIDASARHQEPFFPRNVRFAFRKHRRIPNFVHMWFCPYAGNRGKGRIKTVYHEGIIQNRSFQLYACTCAFGHLAFQVVAIKQPQRQEFSYRPLFREGVAVPLWPEMQTNYVWPHNLALMSDEEFDAFAMRWETLQIL